MRNTIILLVIVLSILFAFADDFQKPFLKAKEMPSISLMKNAICRDAPEVEFLVNPVDMFVSFYDYFPGSICSNPLQLQPEISMPYGYPAGGLYAGLQIKGNSHPATQRRFLYAYFDSGGELVTCTSICDCGNEWFPGIDVDYVTGNPISVWFSSVEVDGTYDCIMSYDLYHLMSGPGLWREPFICIDNPEDSQQHTGHDDDEFIFPRVKIGPSPIEGKRRVHIMANNYTNNLEGTVNLNVLGGYADFDAADMESQIEFEFTHFSFPEFDEMHYNNTDRVIKELAVADDGKVAYIGYCGYTWCMQYSDDYGETWAYYTADARYDLENPLNENF